MMSILESEVDPLQLSLANPSEGYASIRGELPQLLWINAPLVDAAILVLAAPQGTAFWDCGAFGRFWLGEKDSTFDILRVSEPGARNRSKRLLRDFGAAGPSVYARVILGGLTRPFGNLYLPPDGLLEMYQSASRIESFLVPNGRRESVSSYFRRQIQGGVVAPFVSLEDREALVVGRIGNDHAQDLRWLLSAVIPSLGVAEISSMLCCLDRIEPRFREVTLGIDLPFCVGRPGDISVALPVPVSTHIKRLGLLPAIARICEFRLAMCAQLYSLPALERVLKELETVGWEDLDLVDIRNAWSRRFGERLSLVPEVSINPFKDHHPAP
jgi:hypothetical protein